MAYTGQTVHNPVTGETITFLKTASETDGQVLVFDCRVAPGKRSLPAHVHDTQSEHFTIISGTLGVMLGGRKYTLGPGDSMLCPAKIKHRWWNAGDEEVRFRVEVTPVRNLETVLEVIAAMAEEGKLNKRVMPRNPFVLAQFGKMSETYLPVVPIALQKLGLNMGSAFGRLLGYDPNFAQYRTEEAAGLAPAEAA